MSDEANVDESSSEQPVSEETSVSDAMEAREPGELHGGELGGGMTEPLDVGSPEEPEAEVVSPEEERKRDIKRNMAANARQKAARKDAETFGNVPQNTKITETKAEAQEREAAARVPEAPPEGSSDPAE